MAQETPRLLAMILCERVITDAVSQNKSLIDIFDGISTGQLPTLLVMNLVLTFTNVWGESTVDVLFNDPNGNTMLQFTGKLEGTDPFKCHDMIYQVNGLPCTQAGIHSVEVLVDGVFNGMRQFCITLR